MKDDKNNSFELSHRLSQQQADDAVSPYELTMDTLAELGDLIYSGGGVELQTFVKDVQAGKSVVT